MTIGERIKDARMKAGISQQELADKLGIKSAGISQWETDKRTPKNQTMLKIADAIGIDLAELLGLPKESTENIQRSAKGVCDAADRLEKLRQGGASSEDIIEAEKVLNAMEDVLNEQIFPARLEHMKGLSEKRAGAVQPVRELDDPSIEIQDAAPVQGGVQEMVRSLICQTVHSREDGENMLRLISSYKKLNSEGRLKLIERAEEMTYVPAYDK